MKLQNGFELQGNITTTMVLLNDRWTQVLIVESSIKTNKLRELFTKNDIITNAVNNIDTTYFTNGLIDIKSENNVNYVWLYFVNSTSQKTYETEIAVMTQQISDINLIITNMLGGV